MATPTFIAEDADSLYMRLLQYEIDLVKEQGAITKERSKQIENEIDTFYKEYNNLYESLREFQMQDRMNNISSAIQRIQGIATMRWFLSNSNSNSGLNTNSNNNMTGGKKSRKAASKKSKKSKAFKASKKTKKTKKSRKTRSNK
jgi:FtsZ-binding cell division protein ZapB